MADIVEIHRLKKYLILREALLHAGIMYLWRLNEEQRWEELSGNPGWWKIGVKDVQIIHLHGEQRRTDFFTRDVTHVSGKSFCEAQIVMQIIFKTHIHP